MAALRRGSFCCVVQSSKHVPNHVKEFSLVSQLSRGIWLTAVLTAGQAIGGCMQMLHSLEFAASLAPSETIGILPIMGGPTSCRPPRSMHPQQAGVCQYRYAPQACIGRQHSMAGGWAHIRKTILECSHDIQHWSAALPAPEVAEDFLSQVQLLCLADMETLCLSLP